MAARLSQLSLEQLVGYGLSAPEAAEVAASLGNAIQLAGGDSDAAADGSSDAAQVMGRSCMLVD